MGGGSNAVDGAMNADNNDTTEVTSESSNQTDKDINTERCAADIEAVSYTHLTLPTKRIV